MSAEYRVLGAFTPSDLSSDAIEQELRRSPLLPECCRRQRIGVRIPHAAAPVPHPTAVSWHQEGGDVRHLIVWASEQPTEIKTSAGDEFSAQPYDVVWVDNERAYHRQPSGTDETRRWFMAIRCDGALT